MPGAVQRSLAGFSSQAGSAEAVKNNRTSRAVARSAESRTVGCDLRSRSRCQERRKPPSARLATQASMRREASGVTYHNKLARRPLHSRPAPWVGCNGHKKEALASQRLLHSCNWVRPLSSIAGDPRNAGLPTIAEEWRCSLQPSIQTLTGASDLHGRLEIADWQPKSL